MRRRLTAALVAISLLTLVVTVVTLLLPLDRRLRSDAAHQLALTAVEARPTFEDVLREGDPGALARTARELAKNAGVEVFVLTPAGRRVASTDPDPAPGLPAAAASVRRRPRASHRLGGNVIESVVRVGSGSRRYALVLRRRLRDVARTTATVRRALAVSGGLGLLAALAAGFLLAGRLARRITTLRDAMAQAPGDAEVPVDTGHDEIGDLSRSFAELRRRVAEQEEARRRFVATASHELRTPLASLHLILAGVAEELDARDPDLPDVREQIARAGTQSERLVRLAAELLDLSHLDAAVPLRRELVELTEVARSVVAEFRGRPDGAAAELSADTPCWALADPGAVARCVRILVDNALRYGGAARVSVGGPDGVARVAVADDGPGVPPDEAEAVFERFARGSAGATAPGSGLGLAIGRELARAMSGDLRLAEPNGARGATFELVLPPGSGH